MLEIIRKRLTYANVVSTICLFLVLGGTAYAGATALINGATIKNRSIAGKKLKNNTITGRQIKESRLARVPRAARADVATNANNASSATNADTATNSLQLGGVAAAQYMLGGGRMLFGRQQLTTGQAGVTLLDLRTVGGFGRILGTCVTGKGTTSFSNESGGEVTTVYTKVDNGAPDTVAVDRTNPSTGQTVIATNTGNGPQSIWWQLSRLDGTTPHVATIFITSGAILTDCRFTVQAIVG